MTFDEWMAEVDNAVERIAGMSVHDLPDCCFRDWFDDDVKPVSAARRSIREAQE
jgi:hypothetical protein